MIPRLKELYNKEIKLSLKDKYNFKNLNMAPEVEKIVINMGLGIDGNDAKIIKSMIKANNLFPNPILSNVVSDKSIFFLKDT